MMPRALLLALLAACAGCIPFVPCYYAYPSISHVPGVDTECGADVRAFRIDVAESQNVSTFPAVDTLVFTEVPVSPRGIVAGQTQLAVDYGKIWNCIALVFTEHTSHKVLVRIYRPGFQTVEIRSHDDRDRLVWTAAPDLIAQEKAVDVLFGASEVGGPLVGFAAASTCTAHKKALMFAASEYQRLAGTVLDDGDEGNTIRLRLLDKAGRFRNRASE